VVQREEKISRFTRSQQMGAPLRQTQWIQTRISQRLNAPTQSTFPSRQAQTNRLVNQHAIDRYRSTDALGNLSRGELRGRLDVRV